MKIVAGISGLISMLSVGALDGGGQAWWLPALLCACSLAVLFFACARLGFFSRPAGNSRPRKATILKFPGASEEDVIKDPVVPPVRQGESSSMNSTVQSSVSI